ncbi:MAG: DUF1049 domain-containing protein [Alteromonadaceae bacterium]|nr:DUF1049 domain-containing protein [Alteromonadaceae bacterium]
MYGYHFLKLVFFLVLLVFIVLLATVFGAQNTAVTTVNYLIAKSDVEVRTLMTICFILGAVFATAFWVIYSVSLKVKMLALKRKINSDLKPSR